MARRHDRGARLHALEAELHGRQSPPAGAGCAVCGEPLPPGWRHPEHAGCRNAQPERNTP